MLKIAALVWIVLGSTLAGVAVTAVIAVPSLYDQGMKLIPVAAGIGFAVAIPLAVIIAKRIMALTARPA
jgi:hypothetical protein